MQVGTEILTLLYQLDFDRLIVAPGMGGAVV